MEPRKNLFESGSPIENEIPTYRAISPMAVTSAFLGLVSALCFVAVYWVVAAILAVVSGVVAERKIRRNPDILTGRSFAQAGIAMGIIFSITSIGLVQWQNYWLRTDANRFAIKFVDTLNASKAKHSDLSSDVLWYMIPPHLRRGIAPGDARSKVVEQAHNSAKVRYLEEAMQAMIGHAGEGRKIEFAEVESAVYIDMDGWASLLLKVGSGQNKSKAVAPKAHDHHEGDDHDHAYDPVAGNPDYALVVIRGEPNETKNRWMVDQFKYPYNPKSYKHAPPKKADDDGHGHAH